MFSLDSLASYQRRVGILGRRVRYLERAASTNDVALQAGTADEPEGLLVLAEFQTQGRGRLGRRWHARPGECLLLSLLFRLPSDWVAFARWAARVTMLCGLAGVDAVRTVAGVSVALKWPNDFIVTRDVAWCKVGGMLTEVGMVGTRPAFLVVGVGLNVNVAPQDLACLAPNATSLQVEAGQYIDRVALLDAFLALADARYARLRAGWDPLPAWSQRLAWRGATVQVSGVNDGETVVGRMQGVDEAGALLLRLPDGVVQHFPVGDVTLRSV